MRRKAPAAIMAVVAGIGLTGCGFGIQSADLFMLTRARQGNSLTLLVNDGGTISCDGARPRRLPDPLLLQARDLASSLGGDAQEKVRIPSPPNSVYRYTIRLQQGTISFPDTATAGGKYPRLAQAEQFALAAAQRACGISP